MRSKNKWCRWWLEVDVYPFEHALRLIVDQRLQSPLDDDIETRDDDETVDLTGGVSLEGIEALFEQKRKEYTVVEVVVEEAPVEEKGAVEGERHRRASLVSEGRARRASRAEKAEAPPAPTKPDEAVLYYRFVIQRGDGK
jgi:hypothetical protein